MSFNTQFKLTIHQYIKITSCPKLCIQTRFRLHWSCYKKAYNELQYSFYLFIFRKCFSYSAFVPSRFSTFMNPIALCCFSSCCMEIAKKYERAVENTWKLMNHILLQLCAQFALRLFYIYLIIMTQGDCWTGAVVRKNRL